MRPVASFLLALSLFFGASQLVLGWNYINSDLWQLEYPECAGKLQSPINLNSLKATAIRSSSLQFSDECNFLENSTFTISDMNSTYGVSFSDSLNCTMKITKYSQPVALRSVVFHMGSEHAIDNAYYGMESQWYFGRENESKVALSIMLGANFVNTDTSGPAVFVSNAIASLPPIASGNFTLPSSVLMNSWADGKSFFTYTGSLTTPPCTERVDWVVVKEPVHIGRNVHLRFANAMRHKTSDFEEIGGNVRPLRPSNGREVVYRVSSKEVDLVVISAKKSTNIHIVLYVMLISVGLAIFALSVGARIDSSIERRRKLQQEQLQKQALQQAI